MSPSSSSAPTTSPKPTQSPTVSSMPTFQPSMLPSISPTVSTSPTETCYWIDIVLVFDEYPEETSWDIQKINDSGEMIVLKSFNNGTFDDKNKFRNESMCLEGERKYQFMIKDNSGDGICCEYGPGHYNITSEGKLIVQGGEFGTEETTSFSLPFIPGSAISSGMTQAPTTTFPTYSPSTMTMKTPFPTEVSLSAGSPQESVDPITEESCEDITTKKNCIKSATNCTWDINMEGGPICTSES